MLKTNLGIIVALFTLIGTILIGGATFGDVRGTTAANMRAIEVQNQRFLTLEEDIKTINEQLLVMANDLKWIRETQINHRAMHKTNNQTDELIYQTTTSSTSSCDAKNK